MLWNFHQNILFVKWSRQAESQEELHSEKSEVIDTDKTLWLKIVDVEHNFIES